MHHREQSPCSTLRGNPLRYSACSAVICDEVQRLAAAACSFKRLQAQAADRGQIVVAGYGYRFMTAYQVYTGSRVGTVTDQVAE